MTQKQAREPEPDSALVNLIACPEGAHNQIPIKVDGQPLGLKREGRNLGMYRLLGAAIMVAVCASCSALNHVNEWDIFDIGAIVSFMIAMLLCVVEDDYDATF